MASRPVGGHYFGEVVAITAAFRARESALSGRLVGMPLEYRRLRKAALGTALVFTASGAILGTWVSRLPAVRDHLHASPGQLGGALLAMGVGSLLSMPITGHFCHRFGTRTMVIVTAALSTLILAAIGQVDTLLQLTVALFAFGLDRPQSVPMLVEARFDAVDQGVALRAGEHAREVLHDRGVGAECGEGLAVAVAPATQEESLRLHPTHLTRGYP